MVAKVVGLATGAFVASIAVWAFNEWRHVSDEDRLNSALADHCLPYIMTGAIPFLGQGRGVGVYDNVEIHFFPTDSGAAIIFDNRFVANWGEQQHPPLRTCRIESRGSWALGGTLAVTDNGFIKNMEHVLAPLGAMVLHEPNDALTSNAAEAGREFIWREIGIPEGRGSTVTMVRDATGVHSVIVRRDMSE